MNVSHAPSDSLHMSDATFDKLARYITDELGIRMPASKVQMIQSRLLRRVRELGLSSLDDYGDYFFTPENTAPERPHLINAVTTNKTDFFREPVHFEHLVNTVLPQLREPGRGIREQVKIWCAGCSSGEEPYTIAMVLSEYAGRTGGFDFAILGTDISTKVLGRAREGIYQHTQVAPVPKEMRQKYLLQSRSTEEGLVRIRPEVRRKVSFHCLNFMEDDYRVADVFHVIFFRNVMIYFDRPTQEAVVRKLCRNLLPGGYLFVSHSESLAGLDVPVVAVRPSVFRKRGSGFRG